MPTSNQSCCPRLTSAVRRSSKRRGTAEIPAYAVVASHAPDWQERKAHGDYVRASTVASRWEDRHLLYRLSGVVAGQATASGPFCVASSLEPEVRTGRSTCAANWAGRDRWPIVLAGLLGDAVLFGPRLGQRPMAGLEDRNGAGSCAARFACRCTRLVFSLPAQNRRLSLFQPSRCSYGQSRASSVAEASSLRLYARIWVGSRVRSWPFPCPGRREDPVRVHAIHSGRTLTRFSSYPAPPHTVDTRTKPSSPHRPPRARNHVCPHLVRTSTNPGSAHARRAKPPPRPDTALQGPGEGQALPTPLLCSMRGRS